AYDERFLRQHSERFIEQSLRLFPIPRYHGQLRGKIDCVLVGWTFRSPVLNCVARQLVFSTPNIDLNDAGTHRSLGVEGPPSFVHFTSVIEQSDVRQDGA